MTQDKDSQNYYIVEYRLPIPVHEAKSVEEAARIAAERIEREYGVNISKWFARVFEYASDVIGPKKEFFCNPGGVKFRELTQNHPEHGDINE